MKHPGSFMSINLIFFASLLLLLSSCAPAPRIASSPALKIQLDEIKQQQQQQTAKLLQVEQQLQQLQQRLDGGGILTTQHQKSLNSGKNLPSITDSTFNSTALPNRLDREQKQVVTIAASASSYLAAFSHLAAGRFAEAEVSFQTFLTDFPNHQYSPNARYWLASAQVSQGKIAPAKTNLQQIIIDPKDNTKTPAALLQLAQLYQQEGLSLQADNLLEQLRNHYPESSEAQQYYRSNEPTD